jgi:hypothetical protein
MPSSMKVHAHWMNLMKNQIIQKLQSSEILKERILRQRIFLKNHLIKKLTLVGSKCITLNAGHMCKK